MINLENNLFGDRGRREKRPNKEKGQGKEQGPEREK